MILDRSVFFKIFVSLIIILLTFLSLQQTYASGVPVYEDWDYKIAEDSDGPVCYLYIYPRSKQNLDFKRANPWVFIRFNGFDPVQSEFATILGKASVLPDDARLEVGGKSFRLSSRGTNAWLSNSDDEGEVFNLLAANASFSIVLKYSHDTVRDEYRSDLFSKAISGMKEKCRLSS